MNPISLRRTLKVICMSAACAALPACAGNRVGSMGNGGAATDTLSCPDLVLTSKAYPLDPGHSDEIEYPQHKGRIAILKIPHDALTTRTTFTISAPRPSAAQVDIVATNEKGDTITDFKAHPLTLVLFVRDGCSPPKPAHGHSFYIFRIQNPPANGIGDYEDPDIWEVWKKTPRVTAELDHLSGYILAQGIVR